MSTSKLKICMVTTFYPPYNFGGDGIFVERLVNALAADGHEVHVVHDRDAFQYCSGRNGPVIDSPDAKVAPGVTIHTIGDGKVDAIDLFARHQMGRPIGRKLQLERILNQDWDVIHFHNISLMGGPEVLKMGRGVKFCTLHDHWFVCAMHVLWRFDREPCTKRTCLSCTLAGKRPPQLWRYTNAVENAGRDVTFIAPSEFTRGSHLRNGFPLPISALPHFIPDEFTLPPQVSGSDWARPYFLFVGRLEKVKGVQILIEQFKNYHQCDLLIAGTGSYEHQLQKQAAGLNHVHFLGRVQSEQVKRLIKGAIAALVPSLCYETFGLVALEAFAQGTPAIVHRLGALPEVVQNGGGISYESGEDLIAAMERLRTEPETRRQMGNDGLTNLNSNYTQQRHLARYYDMIAQLKAGRSMQEVG